MEYWLKQDDLAIFENLLWSRPENRRTAGKLLIIGGNSHGFNAPVSAFGTAMQAGAGTLRVILPNAAQAAIGTHLQEVSYAPSTKSGSLSKTALAELLAQAAWADGVLLAGDFGRNSETAVLLESFCQKYAGQLTITKDGVDYFYSRPAELLERPMTTIVATTAQLQKLLIRHGSMRPVYYGMQLQQLVEVLHGLSREFAANFITLHQERLVVAADGQVSTTQQQAESWRVATASYASVWWMQNPSKPFEALTTAVYELSAKKKDLPK